MAMALFPQRQVKRTMSFAKTFLIAIIGTGAIVLMVVMGNLFIPIVMFILGYFVGQMMKK
jgi:fatty acid desaturase